MLLVPSSSPISCPFPEIPWGVRGLYSEERLKVCPTSSLPASSGRGCPLPCVLCFLSSTLAWISPLLHTAGPILLWDRERKRADSSLRKQLGSGGWNELLIYAAHVFLLLSLPLQLLQGRFSGFENSIDLSGSDAEVLKYVCLFGFACEIKHHLTSNKQCCYRQCPDSDYAFQKSSLT